MNPEADPLADLLAPERPIAVVDVGANPIDGRPPYLPLLERRLCTLVGFEPQAKALAKLAARKTDLETYLPYVLGDGGPATLHVCAAPGMTSLLEPDPDRLRSFRGFAEWGRVVERIPVLSYRLDDLAEIQALDYLKIDVQGAELSVIRSGRQKLAAAVAIQIEVSFLPLYRGQPAFGLIDGALRGLGLVPHMFVNLNKRMLLPLLVEADPYAAMNQLLEGDLLYVRDFCGPAPMSAEQYKHLALIAHHVYRSYDLAALCVQRLIEAGALPASASAGYYRLIPMAKAAAGS